MRFRYIRSCTKTGEYARLAGLWIWKTLHGQRLQFTIFGSRTVNPPALLVGFNERDTYPNPGRGMIRPV